MRPSRARGRHLERLVAHAYTEMMDLVDDNEIEPVTDLSHVSIRALERGHRHRRQVPSAISKAPDGTFVHGGDLA